MASKRTKYEHWLIGSSTSVLKEEFVTKDFNGSNDDLTSSLPFSGPLQLPTKMQALKLFWFFKDQSGRFNTCRRTNGEIQGCVARIINKFHVHQSQAQIEIHMTFTWPSPDPHQTLTLPWRREFKLHLKFTWRSPGFPWHSPDIYLTTWPSSDLPLTLTRPLPNIH